MVSCEKWPSVKIKDLASYITVGFVGSMSKLFVDDGVPLLRGQNIRPYQLDLTNLKYISIDTHRKWRKSALQPGDVAIVRVGYPGTACVIPEGVGELNAASLVIVRPNHQLLDSTYLCYVLNSPWGKAQVQGRLVGAAQQVFNTNTAAELEISAPPLATQRRIANILSAYDELIENNQRRIRVLEDMARSLYREWFVHFRYPGHESVPLVDSPLGQIPKGWAVSTIGEAASFENGDRGGNYPSAGEFVEEGIPFINAGHLSDGAVDLVHLNYITEQKFNQLRSGKIREGDLVYCLRGSVGRTARVSGLRLGAIASSLVIVRPTARANTEFLFYTLSGEVGQKLVNALDNGVAQPNISVGSLQKYSICLPPKHLLGTFAHFVEHNWELADTLRNQVAALVGQRDLLLPRLLSGQIDVVATETLIEKAIA